MRWVLFPLLAALLLALPGACATDRVPRPARPDRPARPSWMAPYPHPESRHARPDRLYRPYPGVSPW